MFATTWVYESTFSTVNLREAKYRWSNSDESLASNWDALTDGKYTLDFEDLVWETSYEPSMNYEK